MLLAVQMCSEEPLHRVKAVCTLSLLSWCPWVMLRSGSFITSDVLPQLGEAAFISLSCADDVLAIIYRCCILILLDSCIAEKMKILAAWCFKTDWNLRYFQRQHNHFLRKRRINLNIFKHSTSNSSLLFSWCYCAVNQVLLICGFLQCMIFFCCHFFIIYFNMDEVDVICRCVLSGFILSVLLVFNLSLLVPLTLSQNCQKGLFLLCAKYLEVEEMKTTQLPVIRLITERYWGVLCSQRWVECVCPLGSIGRYFSMSQVCLTTE